MKSLTKFILIGLFPCLAYGGPEQLNPFAGMYRLTRGTSNTCPAEIKISITSMTRYATPTTPAFTTTWADIQFIKNVFDRSGRLIGRQPLKIRVTRQTFSNGGTKYDSNANIIVTGIRNFTVTGYIQANGMLPLQFPYTFNVNGANLRFNFTNADYSQVTCDYRDVWQR